MNESILKLIANNYPSDCLYDDNLYKYSLPFKRYQRTIKNDCLRDSVGNKIMHLLKGVFPLCYIRRWTNKEYPSLHFSVLMHTNQSILDDDTELREEFGGRRVDLEIYISLLGKYYYLFLQETLVADTSKPVFNVSHKVDSIQEYSLLKKTFEADNYFLIDDYLAHTVVPNINTELLSSGEVTIFNCLFTDIKNRY